MISDKIQVQDSLLILNIRGLEFLQPEIPIVLFFDAIHHISEK